MLAGMETQNHNKGKLTVYKITCITHNYYAYKRTISYNLLLYLVLYYLRLPEILSSSTSYSSVPSTLTVLHLNMTHSCKQ